MKLGFARALEIQNRIMKEVLRCNSLQAYRLIELVIILWQSMGHGSCKIHK